MDPTEAERLRRRDFLKKAVVAAAALPACRPLARARTASPTEAAVTPVAARIVKWSGSVNLPDGYTVPRGETVVFDPKRDTTVQAAANIVVKGTLRMHPADGSVKHILRFVNVDESKFVGGGEMVLASDVGLWVVDRGVLDVRGTPKLGWNRTGDHATWRDADEILVCPTDADDTSTFAPFTRGSQVPRARPDVPPAEVMNLTRNVRIEGTPGGRSHVHIMATRRQSISYASFRYLGVPTVLGRYPLHFHMGGKGTKGSRVVGCVVRDSGMHAFWPHMSHGITFQDCVAYNVNEEAFGWDEGDHTNDTVWNGCLVAYVTTSQHRMGGFLLGSGKRNAIRNSTIVGLQAISDSGGFHWGKKGIHDETGVWIFPPGNVSHNNHSFGSSTWQNDHQVHNVDGMLCYRNGKGGISHGAYANDYRYRDCVLIENGGAGVECKADSDTAPDSLRFERLVIDSSPIGFQKLGSPSPGYPVLVCGAQITNTPLKYDLQGSTPVHVKDAC